MNFIFGPIFILALLTVYCNSLCFDEIEERHQCSETPPIQTDIDETWVIKKEHFKTIITKFNKK
jgi:hypothetical protein